MKKAAISELKAHLAQYIRQVKSGEEIEIRDRGVPVAKMISVKNASSAIITAPAKDPGAFAKLRFSVRPKFKFDVVEILLEDRHKR